MPAQPRWQLPRGVQTFLVPAAFAVLCGLAIGGIAWGLTVQGTEAVIVAVATSVAATGIIAGYAYAVLYLRVRHQAVRQLIEKAAADPGPRQSPGGWRRAGPS